MSHQAKSKTPESSMSTRADGGVRPHAVLLRMPHGPDGSFDLCDPEDPFRLSEPDAPLPERGRIDSGGIPSSSRRIGFEA